MVPISRRVAPLRIRDLASGPLRGDLDYVLYWMRASRRLEHNFSLDRAVELATELAKPLVIVEALRCDYPWACARHHAFVLEGMADNRVLCNRAGVTYYPYVEPEAGHGKGLLAALAARACVVVTDEHPGFHFPAMLAAAKQQVKVRLEVVDGLGLLPLGLAPHAFTNALGFRAFLQRELAKQLACMPSPEPLRHVAARRASIDAAIYQRWPMASAAMLAGEATALAGLPIDHSVAKVNVVGGAQAARRRLHEFVSRGIEDYGTSRRHPDADGGSGLSPYLHFGHVGVHGILAALADRYGWSPASLAQPRRGAKQGFWGLDGEAEAFLDELVVWRELAHNFAHFNGDRTDWGSLPRWSSAVLAARCRDPRPYVYDRATLEAGLTHDRLWNAAQNQLRCEGRMHNYLRMLWGKNAIAWTRSPEEAYATLIELNNRWALDGRDPNSYAGIAWVFGRYDRPWGPARPIFGTVRYMSSDATARKLRVRRYIARYGTNYEGKP